MHLRAREPGKIMPETNTILEYSSGSTAISLGTLANIMGIATVKAYLSYKTSPSNLDLLLFFGRDITLFAGHGQPEPLHLNGGIYAATKDRVQALIARTNIQIRTSVSSLRPCAWLTRIICHLQNWESHVQWMVPQILKQLPDSEVFATSIDTSGMFICFRFGIGVDLLDRDGGLWINTQEGKARYCLRGGVHATQRSNSWSRLLVGPSSGMAILILGLFKFFEQTMQEKATLDHLRYEDGEIPCVFICCDGPFQYIPEYYEKFPQSHFHPKRNSELLGVDLYADNLSLHLPKHTQSFSAPGALQNLAPAHQTAVEIMDFGPASKVVVLDLRAEEDYAHMKLPNSFNLPIGHTRNPYAHPLTMVKLFKKIDLSIVYFGL
ncbi:unnamed protein product [Rhizoctonia solani]|uniref:Rhodanese domain-containing protein n=1 Tax=Rhizoctonia solani TaxID=456999 RepID=A0A8H3H906_9AGAM|nr:unnamed protein product [Rhizoctonia solani]